MNDMVVATAPPTVTGPSGPQQEQSVWKIIVVGDSNTGKTSIIERYCEKHFVENYRSTIGEWDEQVRICVSEQLNNVSVYNSVAQSFFQPIREFSIGRGPLNS